MKYINIYEARLNYGGPEEGGWYYRSGVPIHSQMVPTEDQDILDMKVERWEEWVEARNEDRPKITSVNSDFVYELKVEDNFARPYPEVRPHYE